MLLPAKLWNVSGEGSDAEGTVVAAGRSGSNTATMVTTFDVNDPGSPRRSHVAAPCSLSPPMVIVVSWATFCGLLKEKKSVVCHRS